MRLVPTFAVPLAVLVPTMIYAAAGLGYGC
jgi:hypothetical protein